MIIPIGTDNPLSRKPLVNYLLIVANFAIFLLTYDPHLIDYNVKAVLTDAAAPYKLFPQGPELVQFISYAFLHASWMHIIGNMLFLYIFGNNVNDKLGHVGYMLLYLGGAVFSGLGHIAVSDTPVLGASGAVAAVTGAYMVLFPKTRVHILYVIFFIGSTELPALYFILFKLIVWDNILGPKLGGADHIAYTAHLAGYAFGIAIPMGMLALKVLPHSHYDLWALAQRWRKRQQFSSMVSRGYDPFTGQGPKPKRVRATVTDVTDQQVEQIARLRDQISQSMYANELGRAVENYLELVKLDRGQVLPLQQQLDVANKLMQTGRHAEAAAAYEAFIDHYKTYQMLEQIELMLGLTYSRYLDRKDLAKNHLTAALAKLTDPGQKKMCQDELDRL